jgi:hypothetical protein
MSSVERFKSAFFCLPFHEQQAALAALFFFVDDRIQVQAVEAVEMKVLACNSALHAPAISAASAQPGEPSAPRMEAGQGTPAS